MNLQVPATPDSTQGATTRQANAKAGRQRITAEQEIKAKEDQGKYDVFLSHNSKDKEAVEEIERRLQGHVEAFLLNDKLPMTARIRPRVITGRKSYPGDYDHLARTDEWTLTAGVDDP